MPKIIENLSDKLINETGIALAEDGYEAVNIRSIARRCGVGVGTVYNYYSSKDALVAAFLVKDWKESLRRIMETAEISSDSISVMKAVYDELNGFNERHSGVFYTSNGAIHTPPRKYHKILRGQIAGFFEPYAEDCYTSQFVAESLITWTIEGVSFDKISGLLIKVLNK